MKRDIENEELKAFLISDLKLVGIPTDFKLVFRGYSKTLYGAYYPSDNKIVIYLYRTKEGELFSYSEILDTLVHEATHHYQHKHVEGYQRLRGVMHDLDFNIYYAEKIDKLTKLGVMKPSEIVS